jgi:tRNA(Ile)-lysidine synthase TilS/MesJ
MVSTGAIKKPSLRISYMRRLLKRPPFYVTLVPVSGGKNSISQVHALRRYNPRTLAVSIDYGIKTEIG